MSTNSLQIPWQDYHIHCLPGIDDGAKSAQIGYEMLRTLAEAGVSDAVATPHFYPAQQTVDEFLVSRSRALGELRAYLRELGPGAVRPRLRLAAEVYLHRGLVKQDVSRLCIEGTPYLLIELPYEGYASWVVEEIWNITKRHNVVPIYVHLERFLPRYSREHIDELLALSTDFVVQFNASAFADKKALKFIKEVAAAGHPVVLGTDAHNLGSRPPDFSPAAGYLLGKRGDSQLLEHILQSEFLG
jgi:protein-tyrosine phosphatase